MRPIYDRRGWHMPLVLTNKTILTADSLTDPHVETPWSHEVLFKHFAPVTIHNTPTHLPFSLTGNVFTLNFSPPGWHLSFCFSLTESIVGLKTKITPPKQISSEGLKQLEADKGRKKSVTAKCKWMIKLFKFKLMWHCFHYLCSGDTRGDCCWVESFLN